MPTLFDLQGHRGARGLKPENTLPGFEVAFDLGVTSIETDVHLTRDGVPVLIHDRIVSDRLCRLVRDSRSSDPSSRPAVSSLSLDELRGYCADCNPDPGRFPGQDAGVTPLAQLFARQRGFHPYAPPTLADLFTFADAYAGKLGIDAGKNDAQRDGVGRSVRFDLELKRVPFRPDAIGDDFDGSNPSRLEKQVVDCVRQAGFLERATVRSFDHRCVLCLRRLEPRLPAALLVSGMAPLAPAELVRRAEAQVYCPNFEFLDESQVRQCHAAGVRVIPWTVNEPEDWARLLDWGVDGITTDYPDRLGVFLRARVVVLR